ncbi:hypothetical protein C8Q74DRAFT_12728 [Fomes fomentarius]|nr:hypothetical protein C8Q74DRAFT_12728 [Fomes fomentarius]
MCTCIIIWVSRVSTSLFSLNLLFSVEPSYTYAMGQFSLTPRSTITDFIGAVVGVLDFGYRSYRHHHYYHHNHSPVPAYTRITYPTLIPHHSALCPPHLPSRLETLHTRPSLSSVHHAGLGVCLHV